MNMKQFKIDNSEKERILNLHESATKRQYLNEQSNCVTSVIKDIDGIRNFVPSNLTTLKSISGKKYNIIDDITICFGQGGETFTYDDNPSEGFKNFKIDTNGDTLIVKSTGGA